MHFSHVVLFVLSILFSTLPSPSIPTESPLVQEPVPLFDVIPVETEDSVSAQANRYVATVDEPVQVLFALTTEAIEQYQGGPEELQKFIHSQVALTNQSLIDSLIDGRIQTVGFIEVDYTNNKTGREKWNQTIADLQKAFGNFQDVHEARQRLGADQVVLFHYDPDSTYCGQGYLMLNPGYAFHKWAFSTVSIADRCKEAMVVPHELGHNYGAGHDEETGCVGAYEDSCGYREFDGFATLMAYTTPHLELAETGIEHFPLVPYWSSPLITKCNGRPCGIVGQADNRRLLIETIPIAKTWMPRSIVQEIWVDPIVAQADVTRVTGSQFVRWGQVEFSTDGVTWEEADVFNKRWSFFMPTPLAFETRFFMRVNKGVMTEHVIPGPGGAVRGQMHVIVAGTTVPFANAHVRVGEYDTWTNESGEYRLVLPPGEHTMWVSGFTQNPNSLFSLADTFTVASGNTTIVNRTLEEGSPARTLWLPFVSR